MMYCAKHLLLKTRGPVTGVCSLRHIQMGALQVMCTVVNRSYSSLGPRKRRAKIGVTGNVTPPESQLGLNSRCSRLSGNSRVVENNFFS